MKFGEQLKTSLIKDYFYYYIAYDDLKYELSKGLSSNSWSDVAEERFVTLLESELDKVYTFQRVKSTEINRRITQAEKDVERVIEQSETNPNSVDEQQFEDLEEDLSSVIADVHDMAKFAQLNYTGFQKIIKKHDKLTGWTLKPIFAARLNSKPFFNENYDVLVVKLSKLYDLVRTRGHPVVGDSSAGGSQQNFVRQTTKYWVHPNNITELKLIILKHLPVLVFNAKKEFEREDSAITSIYYDNSHLDLYRGRLEKSEGAEAIRLRWYGGMSSDTIFVERKTHREDWTGEKSVKARFPLKEKYVNDFLSGKYSVEQAFAKMRKEKKKSIKEIENLEALASEIQYRVISKKLRPVVRSFYNRTAFQLPGDARVRISLDTELSMIREDNFDGLDRSHKNWRRMDIGVDWPFNQLPPKDIERFPYAVLEVKLQTQLGQEPPQWVRDLVSSHLVEAVPKFSKFIHGTAVLLPDMVKLIPFWLPQMDVDIRKPSQQSYGIERPVSQGTGVDLEAGNTGSVHFQASVHPHATESTRLLTGSGEYSPNASTTDAHLGLVGKAIAWFRKAFALDVQVATEPDGTVYLENIKLPPGKTLCVPVRIEPKVYFANERTFLAWVEIGILLSAVAGGLLNYGNDIAVQASIGFFLVAFGTIIYAIFIYLYRMHAIRNKLAIRYDDQIGPLIICVALAAALGVNFVFQFWAGGTGGGNGGGPRPTLISQ